MMNILRWDFSGFQEFETAVVLDDGATLDICQRLVHYFTAVLQFRIGEEHIENAQVHSGSEIVTVGAEQELATLGFESFIDV